MEIKGKEQLEEKVGKEEKRRKSIGVNKGLLITAIVLGVIAIAIVGFALFNKFNKNIH